MVRPEREQLCGRVEIDETLIAGETHGGKHGKGSDKKIIVVIAVEVFEPKGFGRVRMKHISNASAEYLMQFVKSSVKPGSTICTDCLSGYKTSRYYFTRLIWYNSSLKISTAYWGCPGVKMKASLPEFHLDFGTYNLRSFLSTAFKISSCFFVRVTIRDILKMPFESLR